MDYPTRLDFCDGKYTVIYDFSTGQSECLRYGQPWRQLVGDKMVLAMFDRVVELQAENAALKAELKDINNALDDPRTDLTLTAVEVIASAPELLVALEQMLNLNSLGAYEQSAAISAARAAIAKARGEA